MPGRSAVDDPLKNFLFRVEVEGFVRAGFTEVTGLKKSTEVVEYREGGDTTTPKKSAGQTTFENITLSRGQFVGSTDGGDDDFVEWSQQVFDATAKGAPMEYRRTIDIVQYHRNGNEARRWRVHECWPSDFTAFSDLDGSGNDDSIEQLVLTHEGWDPVKNKQ